MNDTGSIIAFKDNSSVIEGYDINYLYPKPNSKLHKYKSKNLGFDKNWAYMMGEINTHREKLNTRGENKALEGKK